MATRNRKKGAELARMQARLMRIATLAELDTVASHDGRASDFEVVEDQPTFCGNARKKAVETAAHLRSLGVAASDLVLADDSGLCVDALDGAPGVHSARYAGPHASDRERIDKLLAALERRSDRGARFVCALCVAMVGDGDPAPTTPIFEHEASVVGDILEEARGSDGFGYDPIFAPAPHELADAGLASPSDRRSFAELGATVKDKIGHRGKALAALARFLSKQTLFSALDRNERQG